MADPIEAHYTPDGDDWTIAVKGRGRTLTGRAPGLIAARDKADQLVEQLAPEEPGRRTVVHLLNGDAVEFTTAYLTARLARTEEPTGPREAASTAQGPTGEPPAGEGSPADKAPAGETPAGGAAQEGQAGGAAQGPVSDEASREVPGPAASAEGHPQAAAKPTPAPRTESQAAHPAVQPTPTEETAPSGS